jgi:type II secretory pathway pseudopilin PulG
MPRRNRATGGFTLLVLLAVLAVLSLCAATTVHWYFARADVTLEKAAVLLANDLRAAQHRSLFLAEPTRLEFAADGTGYRATDGRGETALNPHTEEPFRREYPRDGVFAGVVVLAADAGGDRTLEIDARGRPLEDLEVTLEFDGDRRVLRLAREGGGITILGSTSGWKDEE